MFIRSLARDLGEVLGVGGYLSSLIRTRVGDFTIAIAKRLEDIGKEDIDRVTLH